MTEYERRGLRLDRRGVIQSPAFKRPRLPAGSRPVDFT